MWPYKTRGSRFLGDIKEAFPSRLTDTDFRINAVAIKLWLPEKLLAALDVLCDIHEASRPDVLRALLFAHAFGQVELAHLIRRATTSAEPSAPHVMRSPARAFGADSTMRQVNARFIGKASEDLKLFLPSALKSELEYLANEAEKGLSDYLRSVLARVLLGERFYLAWQNALAEANASARSHEFDGYSMSTSFTLTPQGKFGAK